MAEKGFLVVEAPSEPTDELSQLLDQSVWGKIEELEALEASDAVDTYRWQGIEIPDDADGRKLREVRHALFTQVAEAIGVETFLAMPAGLLNQVIVMAVIKQHNIPVLLNSMMQCLLTGYAHPETHEEAFGSIVRLRAASDYVEQTADSQSDASAEQSLERSEPHPEHPEVDESHPPSNVTIH